MSAGERASAPGPGMRPVTRPMATPSATARRCRCHRRGCESSGAHQRSQRWSRMLSGEGNQSLSLRRIMSARRRVGAFRDSSVAASTPLPTPPGRARSPCVFSPPPSWPARPRCSRRPTLPEPRLAALAAALALASRLPRHALARALLVAAAAFAAGHGLAAWRAQARLADELPRRGKAATSRSRAWCPAFRRKAGAATRFLFDARAVLTAGARVPSRVSLTWYAGRDARTGAEIAAAGDPRRRALAPHGAAQAPARPRQSPRLRLRALGARPRHPGHRLRARRSRRGSDSRRTSPAGRRACTGCAATSAMPCARRWARRGSPACWWRSRSATRTPSPRRTGRRSGGPAWATS